MRIGIIMDNVLGLNIKSDTTLIIAESLNANGHDVIFFDYEKITLQDCKLIATGYEFNIKDCIAGNAFEIHYSKSITLNDLDIALIRKDPPLDMQYLTLTYLLDFISDNVLILNLPSAIRNFPEKLSPLLYQELIPDTIISATPDDIMSFLKKHQKIVIKPMYQHGGNGVESVFIEEPYHEEKIKNNILRFGHVIAQQFVECVGDKRIFILDGEIIGQFKRIPKDGEFRANLALGASAAKTELTATEKQICTVCSKFFLDQGIFFAGIDVVGESLIEINITSPTGIVQLSTLYDHHFANDITSAIERKFRYWYKPAKR